ncbi:hypothetical protein D6Y75_08680 [Escherichia coli]|nr:hypothetical protein [Escherichia coli]
MAEPFCESAGHWMYFRKEALNGVTEPALYFVRRRNDNGCCTHIQFKSSPYAIILTRMIIICNNKNNNMANLTALSRVGQFAASFLTER